MTHVDARGQEAYPARHGRVGLGCRGGAPVEAEEDVRAGDGCPFGK
jgi:hypothetical protein